MASPEDAPTSAPQETLVNGVGAVKDESGISVEEGKTLAEGNNGEKGQDVQKSVGSSNGGDVGASHAGEEEPEKTLPRADELAERGSKAIEDGDFEEAVDCLSRALEIRVSCYGELAPECTILYYKYGCALLYKAQEEADPLGNFPNKPPRTLETGSVTNVVESSGSSKASVSHFKQEHDEEFGEEGPGGKDVEDDNECSEGDNEELAETDEDDSDLDLAWKMLDVARAIVEKCPEDTMEKVNIFAALGEVSMEREDIETSLNDYLKALSILERLVEPDHRRIVEINFRICLVSEVGSKVAEAIPYCEKAISMCKSRIQRLTDDTLKASSGPSSDQSLPEKEEEIELISGILSELEKKLEDLQQSMSTPKNILSEILKAACAKSASSEQNKSETLLSFNSSQVGVMNDGFDSPAASTAATNGSVTHLGVVGRGIKRASINPTIVESSSSKKPSLDLFAEKTDSIAPEVLDPTDDSTPTR